MIKPIDDEKLIAIQIHMVSHHLESTNISVSEVVATDWKKLMHQLEQFKANEATDFIKTTIPRFLPFAILELEGHAVEK